MPPTGAGGCSRRPSGCFTDFRARFLGKCSPVHFFWGAFDLAVTRFSGRPAPPHPGGVPHLPDWVAREAYSHEVSSAGFWPGDKRFPAPAFYSYAYPEPAGYKDAAVRPAGASYNRDLGEFLLPYEAVRTAESPDAVLLEFLQSTYDAAANLARWDRPALERAESAISSPLREPFVHDRGVRRQGDAVQVHDLTVHDQIDVGRVHPPHSWFHHAGNRALRGGGIFG